MIGIYRIKNLENGKCYYGSSKDIKKRWRTHKNQLKSNTHHNSILQRAWGKYGENSFLFEIVELCDESLLHETEQRYLDLYPEYNIGLKSSGGDNLTQNPNRVEIIEKMTDSVKKRYENMTEDERKEKHSKPMETNPNWKGGVSYVYCECGKRIGYGHTHCNKCRPRSKNYNPFFGKQHSDETKKKLSESRKGSYHGGQNITIVIDDVEYSSYGVPSKKLNIPMATIRWRCLSKNPIYKNYKFKDKENITYTEEEQKERFSNPQKGKKTKFNKSFFIDDVEYRTLKDASEKLNIHQMTIKSRLKSKKFDNYRYKD